MAMEFSSAYDVARESRRIEESAKSLQQVMHARSAEGFAERLLAEVRAFEARLDAEHEVGARLVSFGQALQFHVLSIAFIEPSLIVFEGRTSAQEPVRLVQHVNQISFLLMAVPRLEPDKPKQPIGFRREG